MKKLLSVAMLLSLFLAGCGSNEADLETRFIQLEIERNELHSELEKCKGKSSGNGFWSAVGEKIVDNALDEQQQELQKENKYLKEENARLRQQLSE